MRYETEGTIGGWTFYRVTDHGFTGEFADRPLYGFAPAVPDGTRAGKPRLGELYPSVDHAMVAAVGEKYTGTRGAGGTGVDTAAGWFMRMIGADQLVPADDPRRVLTDAAKAAGVEGAFLTAGRMDQALRSAGFTVARDPERT